MAATLHIEFRLVCDCPRCNPEAAAVSPHVAVFDDSDVSHPPTRNKLRRAAINAGWTVKNNRWFCQSCSGRLGRKTVVRKKA